MRRVSDGCHGGDRDVVSCAGSGASDDQPALSAKKLTKSNAPYLARPSRAPRPTELPTRKATFSVRGQSASPAGALPAARRARRMSADDEKRRIVAEARAPGVSTSAIVRRDRIDADPPSAWARAPRFAPDDARSQGLGNNRLAPGIRGSRYPKEAQWRAFDQLPECVADAIRDSRSKLCPVAALKLVNRTVYASEHIALFLKQHAAWTDWRVLAADFGKDGATRLRPDAPKRKTKLGRRRDP